IIASERNGFGYRTDDVGNSTSSAKPFVVGNNGEVIATFNNGNIESNTDIDVYAFTTAGGRSNLTIIPAVHSNLHAKVEIRDQSNNIIQSFKEDSIEVTKINLNLNAGNYYLFISGEGHGDPSTEGYSDYGSLGFYSIAGSIPVQNNYRNPENPSNIANGLDYKYFEGEWSYIPNFAGLTPIKSGVESNFSLASRARNDNFGYSFSGFIDIPNDGQYTFYTNSDDGSKLFIGSTLVVDNDGLHSNREKSGTIGLKAGKHAIKVEFFERGGEEVLGVKFSGPNISKRDISSSQLYRIQTPVYRDPENPSNIVNGVDYKYYEGYEWTVIPNFGLLVSNSEGSSDNFSLNSRKRDDNFGYTFNGFVEVPTDGCYTFYTNSDDGSKLYIGSSLVVRNDSLHPARETSGKINLKAGKHAIKVEFFERTGGQVLDVKYEGPGISKQVIPSNKLFRINTPTLRDPENPQSLSEGLSYRYFEGTGWTSVQDLTALTPIKSGVSSNFSISSRNRNDDFGFEYLGYVNIESSGVYNFFTNSDDGSKLYIGQTLVVDNDGLHGDAQRSGSIGLKPGKHAIKVVFFERTGQEVLEVRYEGPGVSKQVIPDTRLFRTVSGAIASVSDSLEFYPNPTKQFINIEMATGAIISKVVIFDMFGNKDMEVNVDKDSLKLDVSGLQSGFYTVQIVTSDQVFVRRLQIE
ncbi:MAG TPA: PA14 domain-containing protein, partial [Cytophagaceae bacterium]